MTNHRQDCERCVCEWRNLYSLQAPCNVLFVPSLKSNCPSRAWQQSKALFPTCREWKLVKSPPLARIPSLGHYIDRCIRRDFTLIGALGGTKVDFHFCGLAGPNQSVPEMKRTSSDQNGSVQWIRAAPAAGAAQFSRFGGPKRRNLESCGGKNVCTSLVPFNF